MSLRPYQQECLQAVKKAHDEGVRRQLICLPTGVGKMTICAHLPEAIGLRPWQQMLFLVHRDELLLQAEDKFKQHNPELSVQIEKAQYRADGMADIVVASIQTLARASSKRLAKFHPERFPVVVVDECHHATSTTYRQVLKYFRVLKGEPDCDNSKLLTGWTATVRRGDNVGLEKVFDSITYQRNIREMMEDHEAHEHYGTGWLADVIGWRVITDHDISTVGTTAGDFVQRDLQKAINTPGRNRLIVDKYLDLGKGLPGLSFTVDIQHSNDLAEAYRKRGVNAFAVSGKTPEVERRQMIEDYRNGKVQMLCSCAILGEGTDLPIATVGCMARPTKSSLLYLQQLGRILRPFPAPEHRNDFIGSHPYVKEKAIVLDFADLTGRHSVISLPTLFGLNASFNCKGKSVRKIVKAIEKYEAENPGLDLRTAEEPEQIRAMIEKIDLFRTPVVSPLAKPYSGNVWVAQGQDAVQLALPDRRRLRIEVDHLGKARVWEWLADGSRWLRHVCENVAEALGLADQMVPSNAGVLVNANARWRKQPPTEAQTKVLWRNDSAVRRAWPEWKSFYEFVLKRSEAGDRSWSRGAVSQRIDAALAGGKQ